MKRFLYILALLIVSANAYSSIDHFYKIDLEYNHGKISALSVDIRPLVSEIQLENPAGQYSAEIVSFEGKILNKSFFEIPTEAIYDGFDQKTGKPTGGGTAKLDIVQTFIRLPYYEDAKEINIYDGKKKVLTIDVSQYAKNQCGDGVCNSGESYISCKNDCPSGSSDGYCDKVKDTQCDPDCTAKTDTDCKSKGKERKMITPTQVSLGILFFVILLLGVIFIVKKRRHMNKNV